jgi:O-antigen ligase
MVFVVYTLVKTFEPGSLLRFFVYAIGIAALIGLVEAVLIPSAAFIEGGIRDGAFTGMYYDKNGGARVYAYALLIGLGLKLYRSRLGGGALLLLVVCLLLSRSATAAVMVIVGTTLILTLSVFHTRTASKNVSRLSAILLFGALGAFVLYLNYEFILGLLGRDAGLTNRTIIWQLLNDYIEAEYIFGYGFGAFWSSGDVVDFIERWSFIGNAHSGYYEAILHGGIVCLVLVIALIWYAIFRAFKQYVSPYQTSISVVIITIVLLQAAVNYIGYVIINHNSTDMFVFLLVYFIACRRTVNQAQAESPKNNKVIYSIKQHEK